MRKHRGTSESLTQSGANLKRGGNEELIAFVELNVKMIYLF